MIDETKFFEQIDMMDSYGVLPSAKRRWIKLGQIEWKMSVYFWAAFSFLALMLTLQTQNGPIYLIGAIGGLWRLYANLQPRVARVLFADNQGAAR